MEATTGVRPFVGQPSTTNSTAAAGSLPAAESRLADWPETTRLLPWALFGFIAMIWVLPFDSVILPIGSPVDATLDRVFLVAIVAIWLISDKALPGDRAVRHSPIHWAFAIFTLVALLSVILHDETLIRVGGLDLAIKQLALLASYAVFFALAASIIRPTELPKLIKAMLALASFTALAVIVEYRLGTNVFHDWIGPLFPGYVRPEGIGSYDAIGRKLLYGPSVQPLAVAVMFSMALPFAFAWLLKAKERREQLIYGAVVLLLIGGAVATQKKTSMVCPLVCIAVFCAYRPRQMLRLAPFAIVLVGVVHLFAPGALGAVVDQFAPSSVTKVNTTQDRVNDYSAIKPDLAGHLLIGRGYGSYDQKQHRILDNQYLTLGIGVGLLGLLAYLAIFATAFFSAHPAARSGDPERGPPALAAATAVVVAVVAGAILDFLSFPQLPYLFCFIAAIAFVAGRDWALKGAHR
jgi:hypothetical protein